MCEKKAKKLDITKDNLVNTRKTLQIIHTILRAWSFMP